MDEDTCHCGAKMAGSDHCPCCGCEQFEATCDRACADTTVTAADHADHWE